MIIRNEKILIVDDAKFMRLMIKRALQKLGFYNMYEAGSILEAMPLYQQIRPDLVTMDITMPGDSGIDGLTMIKKINPDAKVIMISAVSTRENIVKAFSLGAVYFVSKPFEEEKFNAVLEKALPGPVVKATPEAQVLFLTSSDESIKLNCRNGDIIGRCDKCKSDEERSHNNLKCNINNESKNFISCKHITADAEQAKFLFEDGIFYMTPLSNSVVTRLNGAALNVSQKYPLKSGDMVSFGTVYLKVTV